jgi:hypothetical protein
MYNEYFEVRRPLFGKNAVLDLVTTNKLAKEQQDKWDTLVIAFWIYENHHLLLSPYTKFDELLDELGKLHAIAYRREVDDNQVAVLLFAARLVPPTLPTIVAVSRRIPSLPSSTPTNQPTVEHA